MGKIKNVLIMAGGTGGHIFPALAIANEFKKKDIQVHWLGVANSMESRLIPKENIPLHFISINGLKGKNLKQKLLLPAKLIFAVLQAYNTIKKINPDVVIGMGGYVSGPGGIASVLLRKPLVIHEQNAKPGLTNKYLAKFARRILEAFPDTFPKNSNVFAIGNPVRHSICNSLSPELRFQNKTTTMNLLVLGGSLGAAVINHLVPQVLANMPIHLRPRVFHQTGDKHYEDTLKIYKQYGINAKIVPFINDIEEAYQWADFVLCRAGASTIAELCIVGLGSVLIPYPFAADDHQNANAAYLGKHEAAIVIQQNHLNAENLQSILTDLSVSLEKRKAMAIAAYRLRQPEATNSVLKFCEEAVN